MVLLKEKQFVGALRRRWAGSQAMGLGDDEAGLIGEKPLLHTKNMYEQVPLLWKRHGPCLISC